MLTQPAGPTILGFDVVFIGTLLIAVAAAAVIFAIYTAITVRDPMAKRVKALNDRREQLKAGIAVAPRKRQSVVRRTEATDKLTNVLGSFKMLQDSQIKAVQQKLFQAGIRKKEYAVAVIFARLVAPIALGTVVGLLVYWVEYWPEWSSFKRFLAFAFAVGAGYKGPDIFLQNKITKRTDAIRKGLPDALDLLVICAEAGLTVDAAFDRVARELGRAYPELGDEFAL
ncbi:type II secretion system F family protein, partial [uncultured Novosphingobium sp.]|uniref:type II secretion system F family protein n=1 Tax=uncultured Novosphingobium sp. TaxID=292277 RepID=UPI0037498D2D